MAKESPSSTTSLGIRIDGLIYDIVIRNPAIETLRGVCNAAAVLHLTKSSKIRKEDAESMLTNGKVQIVQIQRTNGSFLHLDGTVRESGLLSGTVLVATVAGSDADQTIRKMKDVSNTSLGASASKSFKSRPSFSYTGQSPNSESSLLHIEVKIDTFRFKIGVNDPWNESLDTVSKNAAVRYLRQVHRISKEQAQARVDQGKVEIISVEDADGVILDADESVASNGLSQGAKITVVLEDHGGRESVPGTSANVVPRSVSSTSKISWTDIVKATDNFSERNVLGKGGQAIVYKGKLLGSLVAVKRYFSEDFREMENEIRVLQKVHHPNVILLMGCCEEKKCIVSEFMEGGSLKERLSGVKKGNDVVLLTWKEKLRITTEMVQAIRFLHHNDVIHRDLKPANVLFDGHGTVKVADMGLAKESADVSSTFGIKGTRGYLDPQYILSRRITKSSDIYALGLMILQMCTNQPKVDFIHDTLETVKRPSKRSTAHGIRAFKPILAPSDSTITLAKIKELLEIGLQCVEYHSEDRPTLAAVMDKLEADDPWNIPSPINAIPPSQKPPVPPVVATTGSSGSKSDPTRSQNDDRVSSHKTGEELEDAMFEMGQRLERGDGVEADFAEALRWYSMAARQGNTGADTALKLLCDSIYESIGQSDGAGEPKPARLVALQQSASRDIPYAQFTLGRCFFSGRGMEMDVKKAVEWWTKAASLGQTDAQCQLAACYRYGEGVATDAEKAVEYCSMAAERGNATAQNSLGSFYWEGYGAGVDKSKAVEWWSLAAAQGHPSALSTLADCYFYGLEVGEDKSKAASFYLKAAAQGIAHAQKAVGDLYFSGVSLDLNKELALEWFLKAADQGDAVAQNKAGFCYFYGHGVEEDKGKAFEWWSLAAEGGNGAAQYNLGHCYEHGMGVEADMDMAANWYADAAGKGDEMAQLKLGICYFNGSGVAVDKEKAVEWFSRAAESGLEGAEVWLGYCYQYGFGVEVDRGLSAEWYAKAAEKGNVYARRVSGSGIDLSQEAVLWYLKEAEQGRDIAQVSLGNFYLNGEGVEVDQAKAVEWFTKAAEQGHAGAQHKLGCCYLHGCGVEVDRRSAMMWLSKSEASQRSSDSQSFMRIRQQYID